MDSWNNSQFQFTIPSDAFHLKLIERKQMQFFPVGANPPLVEHLTVCHKIVSSERLAFFLEASRIYVMQDLTSEYRTKIATNKKAETR